MTKSNTIDSSDNRCDEVISNLKLPSVFSDLFRSAEPKQEKEIV